MIPFSFNGTWPLKDQQSCFCIVSSYIQLLADQDKLNRQR